MEKADIINGKRFNNNDSFDLNTIGLVDYNVVKEAVFKVKENPFTYHIVNYFAVPKENVFNIYVLIANDIKGDFIILAHQYKSNQKPLESLTANFPAMHVFEREMHENFDIKFSNHPWLKPLRYPHNRANTAKIIKDYPFYKVDSHETHIVSVGPIHAGIIEPGHFRFTCNGEMVQHLEIQLGWQHRGVEALFLKQPNLLSQNILAERITGDSTIAHTLTFVNVIESLMGNVPLKQVQLERNIALELERIAMHTSDLSGMCTDVAYQLGSSTFGALRTPIINFLQKWCGSRFGRGLIRVGGSQYPLNVILKNELIEILDTYKKTFKLMARHTLNLPSIIKRFDGIGAITQNQAIKIGAVGMIARTTGLKRDIRYTHPNKIYKTIEHAPCIEKTGDIMSRALVRKNEILQSIALIKTMLNKIEDFKSTPPIYKATLQKNICAHGAVEGFRGEISHTAFTDADGNLCFYKIKDPSLHNWKGLELSLRNLEISDFPINNKSYNLSYCGHDL
ncbi:MAG: NADH-quinone oxidoreductase subunit C [Flavobacteriaceae bacterium]